MSPAKPETDSLRCEVALHLRLASPFQNLQLLQCPPTKNRLLKGNELLTAIWSFETRHKAAALKRRSVLNSLGEILLAPKQQVKCRDEYSCNDYAYERHEQRHSGPPTQRLTDLS